MNGKIPTEDQAPVVLSVVTAESKHGRYCAAAKTSRLSFLLCLLFLFLACQSQEPQTGHQVIAAAVRSLLDKSYAGIDYPAYHLAFAEVEAVSAAYIKTTPPELQDQVHEILTYLRTAEEILRRQDERKTDTEWQATDPAVTNWIEHYPFLRAAIGARSRNVFDAPTALTLLWDKADEVLRGLQIKSKPL